MDDKEEEKLVKMLCELLLGPAAGRYWHHDEDFAAFMEATLSPLPPEEMQ